MYKNNKKENPTAGVQFSQIKNGIPANFSYLEHKIKSQLPIGCIVSWIGGFFTSDNNLGYTVVLGTTNDISGANSYVSAKGWEVCNGAIFYNQNSPIFNQANRHLPELSTNFFISSGDIIGVSGGDNLFFDHIHNSFSMSLSQTSYDGNYNLNNSHRHVAVITGASTGGHNSHYSSMGYPVGNTTGDDADNSYDFLAPGQYVASENRTRNFPEYYSGGSNFGHTSHSNATVYVGYEGSWVVNYNHNHGTISTSFIIDQGDPVPGSIDKTIKNLSCFKIMRVI